MLFVLLALAAEAALEFRVAAVEPEKPAYSQTDGVVLEFEFENSGDQSVLVYGKFDFTLTGSLRFDVMDKDGEVIEKLIHEDEWVNIRTNRERLIELEPGDVLPIRYDFYFRHLVLVPGDYSLEVRYESPVSWETHEGKMVWQKTLRTRWEFTVVE